VLHRIELTDPQCKGSKRIVWLTDIHLDAAAKERSRDFFELIGSFDPDVILVGGDISNGANSLVHLRHLAHLLEKPFYFVLGNHDFYYGSIQEIRELARQVSHEYVPVHYLPEEGVVEIGHSVALIGHDGWADGRAGDFLNSTVLLNDYLLIKELSDLDPAQLLEKLHSLGSEAASYIESALNKALKGYEQVVLLTHAPPFEEACYYEGRQCDANWAPHFVCQAVGEVLEKTMSMHPEKELLVLCGHAHYGVDTHILPNLRVLTGHSELGFPTVQGIIEVSSQ